MPAPDTPANVLSDLPGFERRLSVRYACDGQALCYLGAGVRYECRWARTRDVSARGAGLLMSAALRPGLELTLEFPEHGSPVRRALRARVAHCTEVGDGTWLVGCRFDAPLADHELRALTGT